jgi:tetratricopeptide (TPR) repeat protein
VSKLVIFRGDDVENEVHLGSSVIRIGRDSRNDIVLADKSVTRFHAEIRPENGSFVIVDMKSRNGLWLNGQQIKGKVPLALGVPITLGAYELTLEDDLASESGLDVHSSGTAVNPPPRGSRTGASATQRWPGGTQTGSAATDARKTAIFWSGLVLGTLLLCGITFAVIRYMMRPAPVEEVAATTTTPPQEAPAPAPPVDPNKEAIDRHLADARAAIASREFASALRDHIGPVLELDPANQEALDIKQQAEAGVAALAAAAAAKPPPPPPPPAFVEAQGIPRQPGETQADYSARAGRIQTNFQEGNRSLERQDYPLALARFQLVERDQKDYQGVDALITETAAKQRKAVEDAMEFGRRGEANNKWGDALKWYQAALRYDPSTAGAREKVASLTERVTKDGLEAFSRAEVLRKRNDYTRAIELYKQAADLLPTTHEKHREAQEWLEKLKP